MQRIECTPEFLAVEIVPKPDVDPSLGLYDFHLKVPADAPECNYMLEQGMGQVRIVTENPHVGELPLAVRFSVREDG